MFIIISLLVGLFTSPINIIVDYLFGDIILAPDSTANVKTEKENVVVRAGRRASNALLKAVNAVSQAPKKKRKNETVLEVSSVVEEAHSIANAASLHMVETAKLRNEQYIKDLESLRSQTMKLTDSNKKNTLQSISEDLLLHNLSNSASLSLTNENGGGIGRNRIQDLNNESSLNGYVQEISFKEKSAFEVCNDLLTDILLQRKELRESERMDFDCRWG